ncbi:MAG TPA: alcohol dehydrogenase catalytic domain-containing protein [Chloroflexota bacterium]
MKAAVLQDYYKVGIEEVPEPEPAPNEVKIRVVATGICGSDMHAYKGTHPFRRPPSIQGHELAGDIVSVGAEVTRFKVGDRVTIDPQRVCGVCDDCLAGFPNCCANKVMLGVPGWTGSFGQYIVSPESQLYLLPDDMSYEEGSMVEPLAVGVHSVRQGNVKPGDSVLILGGGTIGLSALAAAIDAGATTTILTDAFDFNLKIARDFGATATVNVREKDVNEVVREVTGGKGVDVAIVAVGFGAVMNQGIAAVKKHGVVVLVGLFHEPPTIQDSFAIVGGERVIKGSQTYAPADVQRALDLIASRKVDVKAMITHRFPIDEAAHAFELVDRRLEDCVKVILNH